MGFDITALLSEPVTASKDYGNGRLLEVTYRPNQISNAAIRKIAEAARLEDHDGVEAAEGATSFLTQLLYLAIVDWNVEAHGEKVAPTFENISALPTEAQQGIWDLIQEDQASRAGKDTAPSSGTTKPRATKTASSRPRRT